MTVELGREVTLLLQAMEEAMWRPETRFDSDYMDAILARDFIEVGQSGRIWSRREIVHSPYQEIDVALPLTDFRVQGVCDHGALVLYTSVPERAARGAAHRSSVWTLTDRWRLSSQQGTPADL